jgi:uncharacterized protein DUF6983
MTKIYELTDQFENERRPKVIRNMPIDGKNYEIQFRFNYVEQAWYLDFLGIIEGVIKVVMGIDMLAQYQHLQLPQGQLKAVLMNQALRISKPSYEQLGSDVKLLYYAPE